LNYATDRRDFEKNPEQYKGKVGDVAMIIRLAVTKKSKTPDLYQIMQVLGEDEVNKRILDCIG
jgi:glutamyl-tRNA synthetase